MNESKAESLSIFKEKILNEDPNSWSSDLLKKCLSQLKLSVSGSKEELAKRVCSLKQNPELLNKLTEK